jgi:hypothetical protein
MGSQQNFKSHMHASIISVSCFCTLTNIRQSLTLSLKKDGNNFVEQQSNITAKYSLKCERMLLARNSIYYNHNVIAALGLLTVYLDIATRSTEATKFFAESLYRLYSKNLQM